MEKLFSFYEFLCSHGSFENMTPRTNEKAHYDKIPTNEDNHHHHHTGTCQMVKIFPNNPISFMATVVMVICDQEYGMGVGDKVKNPTVYIHITTEYKFTEKSINGTYIQTMFQISHIIYSIYE